MRKITLILLLLTSFGVQSQTIFYEQNFEVTSPITNILNSNGGGTFVESTLLEGPSQCGRASKGNTTVHNSANIDFNSTENSGEFLALNPEDPCGGVNDAYIQTTDIDLSAQTSQVYLSFRYLITTTNSFGGSYISLKAKNSSTDFLVIDGLSGSNPFTVEDSWTYYEVLLPMSANVADLNLEFEVGGGNGIAIDDIVVSSETVLSTNQFERENFGAIYPNPVKNNTLFFEKDEQKEIFMYDMLGKEVFKKSGVSDRVDIPKVLKGVYVLRLFIDNKWFMKKIVIE